MRVVATIHSKTFPQHPSIDLRLVGYICNTAPVGDVAARLLVVMEVAHE